ncbi:MAG: hypothetical protein ACI8VW_001399 [bacterium]|jgi:dimethylpropiothetin dethiomethylase
MSELDSAIALAACESLLNASAQSLDEISTKSVFAPDLEEEVFHHPSSEMSLLKEVADSLPWTRTKTIAKENPKLSTLAAVELIGPNGVATNEKLRLGLLLQPACTHYPRHRHAAEELYLVLSGTALWGQGKAEPTPRQPGSFCHHASWEWHEMVTAEEPLLSLWCWTGDIRFDQYQFLHPDGLVDDY